jgi:hypothetical protein
MAYCTECHRLKGVGCACGLTFKEKVQTLNIDKHSLTSDDQQWRDYDRITGQDKRRREWANGGSRANR